MATARIDEQGFYRCFNCGHKLGRQVGKWNSKRQLPAIEIKCSSCKCMNYVMIGGQNDTESQNLPSKRPQNEADI